MSHVQFQFCGSNRAKSFGLCKTARKSSPDLGPLVLQMSVLLVTLGWTDWEGPALGKRLEAPSPRPGMQSREKDMDWLHPALPHPVCGALETQVPG